MFILFFSSFFFRSKENNTHKHTDNLGFLFYNDKNYAPKSIELMGMCTSLTANPMNPISKKPTPVAIATFLTSEGVGFSHLLKKRFDSLKNVEISSTA